MRSVFVVGSRRISCAERGAEAVRQLGEITIRDRGISKSLQFLICKRQQSRLPNDPGLNSPREGEVGSERRPAPGRLLQYREGC